MLYKEEFTLYAFALIAVLILGFLFLFGIAYLINKRLDTLALRLRVAGGSEGIAKAPERLFWKLSKWTIQGIIFISVGLIFMALSGFTPIPVIILWIFFFLVWGMLFLHKFRSISLPTGQFIQLQNIFDEEDDFAIDDDINITSIPRKNHSVRDLFSHYIFTCKLAIRHKKVHFIVGIVAILIATCALIFSTNCMCVALHPEIVTTGLSRKFSTPYCEPGTVCNMYFTLGTHQGDFIVNFQMAEMPLDAFVWYDTESHGDITGWINHKNGSILANSAKMTTISELERYICWADLIVRPGVTYYVVTGYQKHQQYIISKEYKIRGIPDHGFSFVSGGDMSLDANGHKLMQVAAAREPYFAMIGGDITYDNGIAACYRRWDEWFLYWETLMVTPQGYSIPILAAIGNHEAGGFLSAASNDPYFSAYFPQQTGSYNKTRLTYHSHRITKNLFIVVLDTDVVARIDGAQSEWLASELQQAANCSLKAALYHGNLYKSTSEFNTIEARGREFWEPSFDKYNLTMAFENHCHAYKRTKPIRGGAVDVEGGTVYLGDGAWGVPTNPVVKYNYIEVAESKQNVYSVYVDENTVQAEALGMDDVVFDTWTRKFS